MDENSQLLDWLFYGTSSCSKVISASQQLYVIFRGLLVASNDRWAYLPYVGPNSIAEPKREYTMRSRGKGRNVDERSGEVTNGERIQWSEGSKK
jgi:hypothetical protein